MFCNHIVLRRRDRNRANINDLHCNPPRMVRKLCHIFPLPRTIIDGVRFDLWGSIIVPCQARHVLWRSS